MERFEERRKATLERLAREGVAHHQNLPRVELSSEVVLKDKIEICKKAISTLLVIQLAFSINNGEDYNESKEFVLNLLEKYGVKDSLNALEKRIMDGSYSEQDVLNCTWQYECYYSLCWALGLLEESELAPPKIICDCEKSISFVAGSSSFEDFESKCTLRDVEEILDMVDLFYNYHWATVEKRFNPDLKLGGISSDVTFERRRGLEWLISKENDWHEISLDT